MVSILKASLALVALLFGSVSALADSLPNILFIYTDDQAPTAIGLDNPQLRTPHIDRIFNEGARLRNAFVTTPVCSPSRASLMTSRYASELRIHDWINPYKEPDHGLDPDTVTWPELLVSAGYTNGLVGKWHLGTATRFHPTRMGFHYFMGFLSGGSRPKDPDLEVAGKNRKVEGFTPDLLTDDAIAFVRRQRSGPFLLCLHFRAPHAKWLPVRDVDLAPYKSLDPDIPVSDLPYLDVEKVKRMTREYYASVASVDRNVGRLLAELDRLKLTEDTVVIFTSDHGYNLGHHGLWYKGNAQWQLTRLPKQKWPNIPPLQRPNLFDQSLRVPTAVRWPARIKPGLEVTETVSNLDWFPTLLAIAGVDLPRGLVVRGRNILPLLQGLPPEGKARTWDNSLYAEYAMRYGARTEMRAWRTPKWKLMIDFLNDGRAELYDLEHDPAESRNLIDSKEPRIQGIRARLRERILDRMRELKDPVANS